VIGIDGAHSAIGIQAETSLSSISACCNII